MYYSENLATVRKHALGLKFRMCFSMHEKLRIGVKVGLAIQLYADVWFAATVHLQMVVKMPDINKLPSAILAHYFLFLYFQKPHGLFIVLVRSDMSHEVTEKFESLGAVFDRTETVLTHICV